MKPIGYSRRRTSRPSTDHHMVGACDLNGSQSRYSMGHIHHESNYFILLQHKSIYLDGEPHVVLTLLCRAQLHVEQIMLLHSLVAHSRRQSIMFHAGESHDGTALKSTVHCRPMERCARPPRTAHRQCALGVLRSLLLLAAREAPLLGMEESRSQPLELGLENCYDSSKRKSTAERTIMTDSLHSALVVRGPFPPYSYFYTRQSYSTGRRCGVAERA